MQRGNILKVNYYFFLNLGIIVISIEICFFLCMITIQYLLYNSNVITMVCYNYIESTSLLRL